MRPYCESITKQILPPLRALIAKNLIEKYNLTQEDAARKLGVTQGAISQYKRAIRGKKIKLFQKDEEIMQSIENLSSALAHNSLDPSQTMLKICEICQKIRSKNLL